MPVWKDEDGWSHQKRRGGGRAGDGGSGRGQHHDAPPPWRKWQPNQHQGGGNHNNHTKSKRAYLVCAQCSHWVWTNRRADQCVKCDSAWPEALGPAPKQNGQAPSKDMPSSVDLPGGGTTTDPLLRSVFGVLAADPRWGFLAEVLGSAVEKAPPPPIEQPTPSQRFSNSLNAIDKSARALRKHELEAARIGKELEEAEAKSTRLKESQKNNEEARAAAIAAHDQALLHHKQLKDNVDAQMPQIEGIETDANGHCTNIDEAEPDSLRALVRSLQSGQFVDAKHARHTPYGPAGGRTRPPESVTLPPLSAEEAAAEAARQEALRVAAAGQQQLALGNLGLAPQPG